VLKKKQIIKQIKLQDDAQNVYVVTTEHNTVSTQLKKYGLCKEYNT